MTVENQRFVESLVGGNFQRLEQIRTLSALVSGIVAGLLGLTGVVGFVFFAICSVVTSVIVNSVCCHSQANKYFPSGAKNLFSIGGLAAGVMTYVLAWTVTYDSVYIF